MSGKALFRKFRKSPSFVIGFLIAIFMCIICYGAPLYTKYDPIAINLKERLVAPEWFAHGLNGHIFGTDALGRDIFTRLVYGGRVSITVALIIIVIAFVIGALMGMIAGYYGGWLDTIIMRFTVIIHSIPQMLFAACMVAALGASFFNLIFVMSFSGWVLSARVVRGQVMTLRNTEYINASKVMGMSKKRIMITQIFPNVLTPLIINETQHLGGAILTEASLSFLGLGIPVPTPTWGNMISEGREYLTSAPWTVMVPGVALMLIVLAINFIGDGVRDAMDPRNTN